MSELNNVTANNNNQEVSTMNRSELVKAYVAANPNPDQDLCPEIIQYWKNSKKKYVNWSNKSGRRWEDGSNWGGPDCNAIYYSPRNYSYTGMYFKYIPELGCLEVANIRMDGNRGMDGDPRDWEYCHGTRQYRYFAFIGDTAMYYGNGIKEDGGRYYSQTFKKKIHEACLCGEVYNGKAIKLTLNQLNPNIETGDGDPCDLIEAYYTKNWTARKISHHANQINEYELKDITDFSSVPADIHHTIVVQLLSDHILFRKYRQCSHWNRQASEYDYYEWEEQYRVFIDQKGKPTVVQKRWGYAEWKISTASIHSSNYGNPKVAVINEELIDQWLPVKYLKGIIDFHNNINALESLVMDLRHPIVEQLVKSGYPELAKDLAKDNQVGANLKNYFKVERETKQPLYKLLGVNKWLLKAVEELECNQEYYRRRIRRMETIYKIKLLYNRFDISDLSKESIDLVLNGIKDMNISDIKDMAGYSYWQYRRERWLMIDDNTRNFFLKLFRMQAKANIDAIKTYIDIKRIYDRIDQKPDIDIHKFNNEQDLIYLHEALLIIQLREDEEREARWNPQKAKELEEKKKIFNKLQDKRKERFNEANDNYIIRVPDTLEEIIKEGLSLGHCVKNYVGSHACGDTHILFLREKKYPSVSFYTIEINTDNHLVQIHGACNKWLGNNPEAIPFVYQWLNKRGITFDESILLNLGTGYSKSPEYLDESYLTA